jgi:hypothetical protein
MYWQDKLGKTQVRKTSHLFQITAAKTITQLPVGQPVLTTFDALTTQSQIDNLLGTTNEFLLAAFDATAMGTDAFALIAAMDGQCAYATKCTVTVRTGTANVTLTGLVAPLESSLTASTLSTEFALGSQGNLAVRAVVSGLDALTSGFIEVEFEWISK